MGDIAEKIYSVAVDGPSGAGKSSLAKAIAAELHILYVDTGAIYRTIGCYARRKGVEAADTEAVIALLPEVEGLVQRLTDYRDALRDNDPEKMRFLLREGREIKERLSE